MKFNCDANKRLPRHKGADSQGKASAQAARKTS
jgi:hypothetical protein